MSESAPLQSEFGPKRWYGQDLGADAGQVALPPAVVDELEHCVRYLRLNTLPVLALDGDDFALEATTAFARALRTELDRGLGFVLVDRLPLDTWSRNDAIAAYWLLAGRVARPVAQSHDGKLIYDVRDLGRPPGNGIRPDVTNVGQNFHTDNSYNHVPPHYVALLCLQPALRGGSSGIVSFAWALEQMREHHPALLDRLFQPFYFDRQREHADGDVMVTHHPLFEDIGAQLIARLSHRQVINGQRIAGVPLDDTGREALEALEAILNDPNAAKTFMFEPGQVQIINNRALGHRRSAFEDHQDPARKRHLVRLWLRDSGGRGYHG